MKTSAHSPAPKAQFYAILTLLGCDSGTLFLAVKLFSSRQWLHWVALAALVAVFATLAVMQYRWSQEIAQASSLRMRANLQVSINRFREDLDRELSTVALIFQSDAGASAGDRLNSFAQHYQSWQRSTAHPKLVSAIYISQGNPKDSPLLQLTAAGFQPAQWPQGLLRVRDALPDFHGGPRRNERGPHHGDRLAVRLHHGGGFGMFAPGPPWFVDEDTPAMIGRIGSTEDGSGWWAFVVLDRDVLANQVLKDLADRHFAGTGGLEYRVAVTKRDDPRQVLFTTDAGFGSQKDTRADAVEGLFGLFGGPVAGRIAEARVATATPPSAPEQRATHMPWMVRFEPLRHGLPPEGGWQLIVQHRHGSLEAAVKSMQFRNLAISLAVLAVLAITTGMLWVTSRRAQRLAQLQMDFVAAISHELRTPLTVISSAADNIADGVVENRQQFARYGRVIKAQARQLIDLVEQVLMFASTGQQRTPMYARQVEVDEVIKTAIRNTADVVSAAGFHLEYTASTDVPPVVVDPMALAHVLQNLIGNAVKYGGEAKWVGVRADSAPSPTGLCARIHVSDGGAGIPERELARIFEPFYRGEAAAAAQIHGTGLGLAVARAATEAIGGRLTVKSTPGSGSTFTVTLPGATRNPAEVKAADQPAPVPSRSSD